MPTLVISGDKDKVDPVETLKRELLPRISGAVLQVLPDVGHLSPLEAPKKIAHHLDSFAKELQSKHQSSDTARFATRRRLNYYRGKPCPNQQLPPSNTPCRVK